LKETTVKVVPEDLIKDALVVGGIEGVVSVQGENQGKQKERDRCAHHHPQH